MDRVMGIKLGKARLYLGLLAILSLSALVACGPPAPVIQGTVAGVEEGGEAILVADELKPDEPPVLIDIGKAEIGNAPEVGDVVRVVYRVEDGQNRALRVMNITKQNALEKSPGH